MDYSGRVITKSAVIPTQASASGVWSLQEAESSVKNNTWPVAGVPNPVLRSLRFNSADSAYLNRTPSSAGNRKTWTWSGWVKRSALGAFQYLFDANNTSTNEAPIRFYDDDTFDVSAFEGSSLYSVRTTQVFRDVSAWYHFVVAFDTTQATASNRIKVYVNGSQITAFGTANYPTQNTDYAINNNIAHAIGRWQGSPSRYLNGYLTEVNFIDGQALTPSSFGTTDAQTGAWIPIKYTGTYGVNGFYLNFKDNTNTTTLGYDYSGNANNWTTNNFSVTAGAGNDSLTDVPTPWVAYNTTGDVGGVVRGNYATMNPMQTSSTYMTFANGNLQVTDTTASGSYRSAYSTIFANSGKYYFESTLTSISGFGAEVGAASPPPKYDAYIGETLTGYQGYSYLSDGNKYTNDTSSSFGNSYASGDTISVAIDIDAGKIWFAKNGTWQASGDPAAGTNPAFNIVTGRSYGFAVGGTSSVNSVQQDCNFGQRPFAYTPPAGFLSLCTTNLPTPTIGATSTTQANKYFDATLYTGNSSTLSVTNSGSMQPDFVWIKGRSVGYDHFLYDAVRGALIKLSSNLTSAEQTIASSLTSFNSNGFSLGGGTASINNNGTTYVGWQWKANGAGSSNTAGSITSTVSANTTAGFSIVKYTKLADGNSVGHGLGVTPAFIIQKITSGTGGWLALHQNMNAGGLTSGYLLLDTTAAFTSNANVFTAVTSTTFTVGSVISNADQIAYCFAPVAGYSAFGSYTGNGSADGPFVYTGFRPRFVLVKQSSSTTNWFIVDSARDTYNVVGLGLNPNTSSAESSGDTFMDMTSNGFKIRQSTGAMNTSSGTYIYAAFAEYPFKFSNAR